MRNSNHLADELIEIGGGLQSQSTSPEPSFYDQVYQIVKLIPNGRITTYGAIAKALGAAKSSRMVGSALMAAHYPNLMLPIHRVVNRNGLLTGKHHYDYPNHMQELLEKKGIKIENNQVQDFNKVFWNPLIDI